MPTAPPTPSPQLAEQQVDSAVERIDAYFCDVAPTTARLSVLFSWPGQAPGSPGSPPGAGPAGPEHAAARPPLGERRRQRPRARASYPSPLRRFAQGAMDEPGEPPLSPAVRRRLDTP
ncbi:hypothetical protein ACFZDG_34905 [Kitasatospora xanthocidica]|uniref:hypothetical protein n=1 Tax=Kitasatospora xanthocidica TaxID=83382 RepID=UPI0036EDFDD3